MRLIDADALMNNIKLDAKKAIEEDDKIGSFWLGYAAGLVIKEPTIQSEATDEQVLDYCKKRCLHIVTDDFFRVAQPESHEGHWILHESPDGGESMSVHGAVCFGSLMTARQKITRHTTARNAERN